MSMTRRILSVFCFFPFFFELVQKALAREKPWDDLCQVLVPALGGGVYTITKSAEDEGGAISCSFEMTGIRSLEAHGLQEVSSIANTPVLPNHCLVLC